MEVAYIISTITAEQLPLWPSWKMCWTSFIRGWYCAETDSVALPPWKACRPRVRSTVNSVEITQRTELLPGLLIDTYQGATEGISPLIFDLFLNGGQIFATKMVIQNFCVHAETPNATHTPAKIIYPLWTLTLLVGTHYYENCMHDLTSTHNFKQRPKTHLFSKAFFS